MPEGIHVVAHPQVGPALSATTWVGTPVVGATSTFLIKVSRLHEPVLNAVVTVRVRNAIGSQVYPPSGVMTVPASTTIPGTYMLTPVSTNIFSAAGSFYTINWMITVPSSETDPELILPMNQKVIAQAP